ncbi:MAG: hypothetical protein ACKOQ4_12170 [Mycobacterium sp.]
MMVAGSTTVATRPESNLLSFNDQGLFLTFRATDQESIMQAAWIYEHPLDYDGLRRFHDNFGYGVAGRRIERSVLPFGRHRWVSSPGPAMGLETSPPRDRSELTDWLDERAQLPVDPEWGPGWRIGVLPMTDGSTAVTLTGSHGLGDGIAAAIQIVQAVLGIRTDLGYPPPHSRTRSRAVIADLRQAMRDLPETLRALIALVKLLGGRQKQKPPAVAAAPAAGDPHENVMLPSVFATLDLAEWDAAAARLGGNGHSLLAGFAARLARRLGRVDPDDGSVTLLIPISERDSLQDDRANAVTMARTKVDPDGIERDLATARSAMREGVERARREPDQLAELTALVPWVPRRAAKGLADAAFGFTADLPVFCSNVGDLPPDMLRADGTEAEYLFIRGIDRRVTRGALERRSGLLTVMAGRVAGRVVMSVISYQPGGVNTKAHLRDAVADALGDYGLRARIES